MPHRNKVPAPSDASANGAPIRILIVDDSVVARTVLGRAIDGLDNFMVVGSVADAASALAFLRLREVDLILLDIEMPGVDGLTALPDLIIAGRGARILVVSSSCGDGAATTIQALSLGAADTLVKPEAGTLAGKFSAVLAEKLTRLVAADENAGQHVAMPVRPMAAGNDFDIVAIGASTGGIHALSQLLRAIPTSFQLPILITQHLPASFMPYFAAQIAVLASRPCDVATDHMRIEPGRIVIAPGEAHLRVVQVAGQKLLRLTTERVASGCMPSVDPMFASLADVYGKRALAVVLSGMGRDGSDGAQQIVQSGGTVVIQDKASSVVWGMPGAVAVSGIASAILPPAQIGSLIAAQRRPAP